MKITRAVVPSLFTVLNMFCGFFSIINSSHGKFEIAGWLIILGAVFDGLDGVMARITKSSSKFGVEFDSLSDLITFGAAPSFLSYQIYLNTLGNLGILISSLPLILGGIRLARFNVQLVGFDKDYFKGLPIPAQALVITTFIVTFNSESGRLLGWRADVFPLLVVVMSLLMISTFKYDTLPKFSKKNIAEHPFKFVFVIVAFTAVIMTKGEAIFSLIVIYSFSGIIRWIGKVVKKIYSKNKSSKETEISSVDV